MEKWTDQRSWDAILANMRAVVATPAILKDALSHGFVRLNRIALCVFDKVNRNSPLLFKFFTGRGTDGRVA